MAEESYITPELQTAIGRETEPEVYEVDKSGVRMFARAVGYSDRVFYDEEYAKAQGYRGLPAPPGYFGLAVFDPETTNQTSSRRIPEDVKIPLTRRLNGGNEYEHRGDICAGDVLTMTEKITDIKERPGKMGTMLIITREKTFKNQNGETVLIARNTGIAY